MILCGSLILLFFIQFASSELCRSFSPCKCVLNSSSVIDLSTIGKTNNFPLFYDVSLGANCSNIELYSYNPCYEFDLTGEHTVVDHKQKPCAGAAACVKVPGGAEGNLPEEHAIGLQKTSVFGKEENGSIYINYTVPFTNRMLKVYLTCSTEKRATLSINQAECTNDQVILNFTSQCACPNGCPSASPHNESSSLSTGSTLLIVFFTFLLAYLIVGIAWNFFNGAKGIELVPNLEFWNELPVLIMEGITFTTSCFGRRPTYSEV